MAFMLGDFTNGLFGGASNVFSLATRYMELKGKIRDRQNADEVENAMQASGNATGGLSDTTPSTMGSSATPATDTSRPTYASFDDDPELSKLPPLKKAAALELSAGSPLEGRGVYGRGQPTTPSSPREGKAFGGAPSDGALGRLSNQPGPGETEGAQGGSGSGLYDWLGSVGQRMRAFSAGHT